MKLKNASAMACAVALFLAAGASMAEGKGAQVELISLDGFVVFNPCTFEEVMFSGSYQLVSRFEEDANGGFHVNFNTSARTLAAIGLTSGERYKIVGTSPVAGLNISGNGTETYSFADRWAIVSQSGDANFFITSVTRTVINANGVQTVENIANIIECR